MNEPAPCNLEGWDDLVNEVLTSGPAGSWNPNGATSNRAVAAVRRLSNFNRDAIRKQFEARFTARRMALDYLAAYRSLMEAAEPRIKLVSSAE